MQNSSRGFPVRIFLDNPFCIEHTFLTLLALPSRILLDLLIHSNIRILQRKPVVLCTKFSGQNCLFSEVGYSGISWIILPTEIYILQSVELSRGFDIMRIFCEQ